MKPYRPSNGSEGDWFQANFCERCVKDKAAREGDYANGCDILCRALLFGVKDKEYPREWRYDSNGDPECTAFRDEDDPGNRPPQPDPDPLQLVLIADPTEDIALPVPSPEPVEVFA